MLTRIRKRVGRGLRGDSATPLALTMRLREFLPRASREPVSVASVVSEDRRSPPSVPDHVWDEFEDLGDAARAFVAAGWVSYLPGIAFDLYSAILRVAACGEPATERDIRRFLLGAEPPGAPCLLGDFDAPIELCDGSGAEEASWDQQRWRALRAEAGRRGLTVATPKEILGVLCELGLIRSDGVDGWSTIAPVPLLEDVIEVSHPRRQELARMRAHVRFAAEKRLVGEWLHAHRGGDGESVVTSVATLAESIRLAPAAVRSALALLVEDGVLESAPVERDRAPARALEGPSSSRGAVRRVPRRGKRRRRLDLRRLVWR